VTRTRLAALNLPPFNRQHRPAPRYGLDVRQPPPDEMLHIVGKEHRRRRPARRNVCRRIKEVGNDHIEVATTDSLPYPPTQRGRTPFPEVDGVPGKPGSNQGACE